MWNHSEAAGRALGIGGTVVSRVRVFVRAKEQIVELGAFSMSLAVKDIAASKSFYEKFGFEVFGGDAAQNWLIMKNGDHVIGLFQGMFEKNMLTFNPGWDQDARKRETFTDVRGYSGNSGRKEYSWLARQTKILRDLPASWQSIHDGNPILVDQHV